MELKICIEDSCLNMRIALMNTCRHKKSLGGVEEDTFHRLAVVHGYHTLICSGIKHFHRVVI